MTAGADGAAAGCWLSHAAAMQADLCMLAVDVFVKREALLHGAALPPRDFVAVTVDNVRSTHAPPHGALRTGEGEARRRRGAQH